MEISGLPLHPLVVHATVVLVPLSAVLAVLLAVVPRWRWLLRWPAAVGAVGVLALAWAARLSGEALVESRPELASLVEVHQERGDQLAWTTLPFGVLVLAAAWLLPGGSALASGRGARESRAPGPERLLAAAVVVAAVAVGVLTVLTGDSGARAVWG